MKIKFLGTGTSQGVPVIACQCSICTSSDKRDNRLRSSVYIETANNNIVIDTGPDFRQQMLREKVQKVDVIIFTHEHKDHIAGLDDVRAFNFKYKMDMPIYATEQVQIALKREYHYIFAENPYPGIPKVVVNTINTSPFYINDDKITPIEVLHHKLPVLGYRIGDFSYITDANFIDEKNKEKLKGSKILVLNALRKEKHISHFTLEEAIALAEEINAEKTYFTHISHLLGKHEDIEQELPKNMFLAYDGMTLEC